METSVKESVAQNPLISVIVPAYNIQNYIAECLRSIADQTYEKIEIIVVNDGSTDDTGMTADRIMEQYPEKIRVFHKDNMGVFAARLFGAKQSHGSWIAFVDGDDILESDMYERLLGNAVKYGADISHCGYQTIVNNGERVHYFYNTGRICRQDHQQGINDLLSGEFIEPSVCNKLYKAELFRDVYDSELLDSDIKYTEDLLLNYILFRSAGTSIYEDFCPYHYMVRKTSASRSGMSFKRIMDPVRVCELILSDGENQFNQIIVKKYLSSLINALYNIHVYDRHSETEKDLRTKLRHCKGQWFLLRRADRIKLQMLLYCPGTYHTLYRLYCRYFRKRRYE